ncbi:MAG: tetratricopeptide repeat protein [Acidobacteria bacterium]|nr:tetratricopeptide repeat protein [Acidobacteriota bacterium]
MQHQKLLLLVTLLFSTLSMRAMDVHEARSALMAGRVDEVAAALEPAVKSNPKDAVSHHLLCRAYYAQELPDRAVPHCEAAVANDSGNAIYYLWLGRAYGLKADKSGPFTGFSMAKRSVASFERAFQLAPTSLDAINDLGEFYARAPSIVGGGTDKARQLAERIQPLSAAKYHRILSLVAEKEKDYGAAEQELKKEIEVKHTAENLMDLVAFYDRRKRVDDAVSVIRDVINTDRPRSGPSFDAATFLTEQHRDPALAERLLKEYLASPARSDQAPAFRAHVLLGKILEDRGDKAGATAEYQAALALAKDYPIARHALGM